MKFFIHSTEINYETAVPLLDFIQNNEGPITIGMNSGGGSQEVATFILEAMNQNADRITLVALAGVYSAAFFIFFNFKGKRKMTYGARGMWHYSCQEVNIAANGKPACGEGDTQVKNAPLNMVRDEAFGRKFMTRREVSDMKRN